MTGGWFAQQLVGSVIGGLVFTAIGSLLVWWKARPFWHKHKQAILKTLYGGNDD